MSNFYKKALENLRRENKELLKRVEYYCGKSNELQAMIEGYEDTEKSLKENIRNERAHIRAQEEQKRELMEIINTLRAEASTSFSGSVSVPAPAIQIFTGELIEIDDLQEQVNSWIDSNVRNRGIHKIISITHSFIDRYRLLIMVHYE